MAYMPSLQELLQDIPEDKLNSVWSDVDLARMSELIVYWEDYAPFLSLTEADEANIKYENKSYSVQKLEMLRLWKAKNKKDATYRQLSRVFYMQQKSDLVDKVKDILLNPSESLPDVPMNALEMYQFHLQQTYKLLPYTGVLVDQWPILKSTVYTTLTVRETASQKKKTHTDTLSSLEYPLHLGLPMWLTGEEIELHQLFDKVKGRAPNFQRLLILGCPGSGKTTLTWNASQKWAKKELFQEFSHFISIPLRSQKFQEAKCLTDLIIHNDRKEQKIIANAISRNEGNNTCFWFDGWDELPQDKQMNSFVAHFIRGDTADAILPASVVVVTARHESSLLGEMWDGVVEINGLTKKQVYEMVINSTKNTQHNPHLLLRSIEIKHHLQNLCSVPIMVAILIYLFFTCGTDLPDTQTELFKLLILHLLKRNLKIQWKYNDNFLRQFEDLPKDPSKCFTSLCKLAFQGMIHSKTSFCRQELPKDFQVTLPQVTLGLMNISPRFERFGLEEELTFLHVTLQEFLAGVYISTLDAQEQAMIVKNLISSKQSTTLLFYAGLTKLREPGAFDTIYKAATNFSWTNLCLDKDLATFFMFMNCLSETQSPEICHRVKPMPGKFNLKVTFNMIWRMNALDVYSFANFVAAYSEKNSCYLTFEQCGGPAIGLFADQLRFAVLAKCNKQNQHEIALKINPSWMERPSFNDIQALSFLLQSTKVISFFELHLGFWFIKAANNRGSFQFLPIASNSPAYGAMLAFRYMGVTMKCIIEGLSRNTSCRIIKLQGCNMLAAMAYIPNIFEAFEYYLVLLLCFCTNLECIGLHELLQRHHNYYLFAAALKLRTQDKGPHLIDLSENNFLYNQQNLLLLTDILCKSQSIDSVVLYKSLTSDMLSLILKELQKYLNSPLKNIYVDFSPSQEQFELIDRVNKARIDRARMSSKTTMFIPVYSFRVVVKLDNGTQLSIFGVDKCFPENSC